jgi:hypothetical protein
MDSKVDRYYDYVADDLMKHTHLDVSDGVIGYPGRQEVGYLLIGDIDYEINMALPFMVDRYGVRDEDKKEILDRYKLNIMEKLWGFKHNG